MLFNNVKFYTTDILVTLIWTAALQCHFIFVIRIYHSHTSGKVDIHHTVFLSANMYSYIMFDLIKTSSVLNVQIKFGMYSNTLWAQTLYLQIIYDIKKILKLYHNMSPEVFLSLKKKSIDFTSSEIAY